MASGDVLCRWSARDYMPPLTLYATLDQLFGGSTPQEAQDVLDFDGTAAEYADFSDVLPPQYDGGGLKVTLVWSSTATTGNVRWGAAFRRFQDDAEDLDTAHTYDYNEVTATSPSAVNECAYDEITFTNGADMDSVGDGEKFNLRIRRDPTNGGDNLATDASIWEVVLSEV